MLGLITKQLWTGFTTFECEKVVVVQLLSHIQLFVTPWTAACQVPCPSLSPGVCSDSCPLSWWCHPAISIFPSIRVFSNESALHIRWPKYWSFSFNISSSNEYSGLISFRIDWFDLLAFQGTIKCLLQHHSLRASILCHSAFFTVQPSHSYMTTGKSIALTIWTFVDKVMSGVHETETFRDSCFAWWECVLQGCFTLLRKSNQTGFWSSV